MELEVNIIKLEDGIDYVIVDAIQTESNKYLFLANKTDETDVCIRKIIQKDNKEYLIKLDNDDEFEEVLTLFNIKHRKKEGNNEE